MVVVNADTVIIGAGFAGLACGQSLGERGVEFLILEARDRVGGRAWTDYGTADGAPLELGALMVHGRHVATQPLVRTMGLHTVPLLRLRAIRLSVNQRLASMPWMALPFHPVVGSRRLYAGLVRLPKALGRYEGEDQTLAAYLEQKTASPAVRALVELNHAHTFAMDPDSIGLLGPAEETRSAPVPWDYRNYRVVEGYSELARRVAQPLSSRLRLRSVVRRIQWSTDPPRVEVEASHPDGDLQVVARRAVVTLPLGVLQSRAVEFDPPLPESKRNAIDELVMADAFTVHVRLRGGTLGRELGEPAFVWGRTPSSFFLPRRSETGGCRVVSAFTVGREAKDRLRLSDPDLVDVTLAELREVLPRSVAVGEPDGSIVHRWSLDPFTNGAYSCIPLGGRLEARRALARPLPPTLFFAGEATHCFGSASTVHGAIETGRRAAEELLAVGAEDS
jgi:monoamine oxidase